MTLPKDISKFKSLEHVNVTLFGKGDLADIIELRILCPKTSALRHTRTGGDMTTELGPGVVQPRNAKANQQPPNLEGKEWMLPWGLRREHRFANTLILDKCSPEL